VHCVTTTTYFNHGNEIGNLHYYQLQILALILVHITNVTVEYFAIGNLK